MDWSGCDPEPISDSFFNHRRHIELLGVDCRDLLEMHGAAFLSAMIIFSGIL